LLNALLTGTVATRGMAGKWLRHRAIQLFRFDNDRFGGCLLF
jgi:hypothetical protein